MVETLIFVTIPRRKRPAPSLHLTCSHFSFFFLSVPFPCPIAARHYSMLWVLFPARFNADGTPRTDMEWLNTREQYDPSWSTAEAWQRGYHPDGRPRQGFGEDRKTRRMSRLSIMGIDDGRSVEVEEFDRRARASFHQLHPTVSDPMGILEEFVAFRKWRLIDLFYQMDRDRSGQITIEELEEACEELEIPLSQVQLEELIFRLDLDGDDM